MTSLAQAPADVVAELAEAGLDPDHVWAIISEALREDLPG